MRLPRSIRDVAEIIGAPMALRLEAVAKPDHKSKRKRGYKIRVPLSPMADEHPLVSTIGRKAAELMQRHHGGETIPFPARQARALRRDVEIARGACQGLSIAELCERHRVSSMTVKRALERVTHTDIATHPPPPIGSSPHPPMRVQGSTAFKA